MVCTRISSTKTRQKSSSALVKAHRMFNNLCMEIYKRITDRMTGRDIQKPPVSPSATTQLKLYIVLETYIQKLLKKC